MSPGGTDPQAVDGPGAHGWRDDDGLGWHLTQLGPGALRLAADAAPSADLSLRLAAVWRHAWALRPMTVRDLVVGYRILTAELRPGAPPAPVVRALAAATRAAAAERTASRSVTLPVAYGDAADRDALEAALGLPWAEVVARHAAPAYRVAFLGFTPGFPYLHGLDAALTLPRRRTPRALPAGAVAIADGRAGVYPSAGPGGWWVLGTTPVLLFDASRAEPTTVLPGDELRFAPLPGPATDRDLEGPPARGAATPSRPGSAATGGPTAVGPAARAMEGDAALTLLEAWPGAVTLQGRPRDGVGHLGMAQAGALDPRAFAAAARLAGAPLAEPALELAVPHATLRAGRPLIAAAAGGGATLRLEGRPQPLGRPFAWPAGAHLEVRPDGRASGAHVVLAVGGGLMPLGGPAGHPALVGAGSTDTRAGVGGFGRPLQAGDALALAGPPRRPDLAWLGSVHHGQRLTLRLYPGPHGEAQAYAALLTTAFRLTARDRMGARLDGRPVHPRQPDVDSEGVPLGAVQLPADGRPIVLLADRGRTGGYAVAGVVDPRDLPALSQARPGAHVVFEAAGA